MNYGLVEAHNRPKFKNLNLSNLILKKKKKKNVTYFQLIRVTNIPKTFSLVVWV